MAKIQARNFPEDLYQKLIELAAYNERSVESQIRFMLIQSLNKLDTGDFPTAHLPEWVKDALNRSATQGYRSFSHEILKRLIESLEKEGINSPT